MKKKDSMLKVLLPILIVLGVLMLIFNKFLFQLKDGIDNAALPAQSKIYSVGQKLLNIKNVIFSQDSIVEENKKLKEENMQLKLNSLNNTKIQEENDRLLKLLEMKETKVYKDTIKFARVMFTDVNNINNKIHIDLGAKDGMQIDMIAVYGDYLVGKISEVHDTYSVVDLISNPSSMVSVRLIKYVSPKLSLAEQREQEEKLMLEKQNEALNSQSLNSDQSTELSQTPSENSNTQNAEISDVETTVKEQTENNKNKVKVDILGVARGSDEENGDLYFQPSIFNDDIAVGDEVFTSGISNIYPEGIKVGKIEEINEKENYAYKMIRMKPGFEAKDLKEVIIINHRNQ